jgi:hypothetical protein
MSTITIERDSSCKNATEETLLLLLVLLLVLEVV